MADIRGCGRAASERRLGVHAVELFVRASAPGPTRILVPSHY